MSTIANDVFSAKGPAGTFRSSTPQITMTRRLRKTFFILTVLFYIPACLSLSASALDSLVTDFDNSSDEFICGCDDASCCCGAPCCAPKIEIAAESSCCGSSETDHPPAEEATLGLQMAWKASCTCGGSHADHSLLLNDPQYLKTHPGTAFWLAAMAKNTYYFHNWTSIPPLPLEQVPKSFLYS